MEMRKGSINLKVILCLWLVALSVSGEVLAKPSEVSKGRVTVDGFRSARFGMKQTDVLKAIYKDFKVPKSEVHQETHPMEKTKSFWIRVKNVLSGSGISKVYYVFGYKSGRLIQVNVLWGKPATDKPNPQKVIDAANQLRDYFLRQGYQKEGLVANAPLGEGLILVFRGKDAQGRMVVLLLSDPAPRDKKDSVHQNISLRLSYVEKPEAPDIFHIPTGDF